MWSALGWCLINTGNTAKNMAFIVVLVRNKNFTPCNVNIYSLSYHEDR